MTDFHTSVTSPIVKDKLMERGRDISIVLGTDEDTEGRAPRS